MSQAWLWLGAAVLTQWGCVAALRASEGLRRVGLAAITFLALLASVACISVSLTHGLTVAVAYGVWTGAGIALAAVTGVVVFKDRLTHGQVSGLILVIAGVVTLQFASGHG